MSMKSVPHILLPLCLSSTELLMNSEVLRQPLKIFDTFSRVCCELIVSLFDVFDSFHGSRVGGGPLLLQQTSLLLYCVQSTLVTKDFLQCRLGVKFNILDISFECNMSQQNQIFRPLQF